MRIVAIEITPEKPPRTTTGTQHEVDVVNNRIAELHNAPLAVVLENILRKLVVVRVAYVVYNHNLRVRFVLVHQRCSEAVRASRTAAFFSGGSLHHVSSGGRNLLGLSGKFKMRGNVEMGGFSYGF